MVQREVGERLAAGPGEPRLRHPVGEGGVLGHGRGGRHRSAPTCSCRGPGRVGAGRDRRRPDGPAVGADPERLFALVRAGFGQRRKMLRRSLAGLVAAEAFEAAGVAPDGPGRGARRRTTGAGSPTRVVSSVTDGRSRRRS